MWQLTTSLSLVKEEDLRPVHSTWLTLSHVSQFVHLMVPILSVQTSHSQTRSLRVAWPLVLLFPVMIVATLILKPSSEETLHIPFWEAVQTFSLMSLEMITTLAMKEVTSQHTKWLSLVWALISLVWSKECQTWWWQITFWVSVLL